MARSIQQQIDQLETVLAFESWLLKVLPWVFRIGVGFVLLAAIFVTVWMLSSAGFDARAILVGLLWFLLAGMFYGFGRLLMWMLRWAIARTEAQLGALIQQLDEEGGSK